MTNIPQPTRPGFAKNYGIDLDPEGMLPWNWVDEQMAASRNYWVSSTPGDLTAGRMLRPYGVFGWKEYCILAPIAALKKPAIYLRGKM
jgi:hypothetical protein